MAADPAQQGAQQGVQQRAQQRTQQGVLAGLRVLDLSWGIAGPMTTMLLAGQGARVTKIEPPGGDPFRWQPGYRVWNRGKRSLVLDLKTSEDRARLIRLASEADVLVESFSPGVTERLGIDHATLATVNPRLVYCSITGYGRDTKDASRPGYDALVQARTGMQWDQRGRTGNIYSVCRRDAPLGDVDIPTGALERPYEERPYFVASRWPSLGACHLAAIAINAALYVREQTGRGQRVETSLLLGAIGSATMIWQRPEHPEVEGYVGWYYDARAPRGFFRCSDGRWVCYSFPSPQFLMSASAGERLRATEETVDPKKDTNRFSPDHFELPVVLQLYPQLREAVERFPSRDWVGLAAEVGVPLSPVYSPAEALADPRFLADGCVVEVDDPEVGTIRCVGSVYHLSRHEPAHLGPAPVAGEHTREVLAELEDRPRQVQPGVQRRAGTAPGRAPLAGIRVLDFGTATAGPFGAQVLSDLGAEVIRVNSPRDEFLIGHQFICAGRGKRSLCVDLKDPRSREIVERLVKSADVVHFNIRLRAAERLGLGYERLRSINPRLVYCHTGAYERGEREDLPSNDVVATAVSGVAWEDGGGDSGGAPMWAVTGLGDVGNGYLSALGVVQALYDRERTGLGQEVYTSLAYACLLNGSYTYLRPDGTSAEQCKPGSELFGWSALYRLYETEDAWICVAALADRHWRALCEVVGRHDLLDDPRFSSREARSKHDDELVRELSPAFSTAKASEWIRALDRAGVPAEVSDPDWPLGMFDDEELTRRGWVTSTEHPTLGRFDQHGILFDFSETPGRVAGPPPMLGQHTQEVLSELGFGEEEIAELERERVVRQWSG